MSSRAGRLYFGCVAGLGVALIVHSSVTLLRGGAGYQWMLVAALACFSARLSIRIGSLGATVSASEALVFTAILLYGPAPATLTAALDGLVLSWTANHRRWERGLFNTSELAIAAWVSGTLFYEIAGIPPLSHAPAALLEVFGPLLLLVTVYFLLNTTLTAFVMWFDMGLQPAAFARLHAVHVGLNYGACLGLSCLLVQQGTAALALLAPFLMLAYVSIRASVSRAEDATRHLAELNDLYVSTVETLAMAVDAKDQVTHGHIRRVQRRAVALAQRMGVRDLAGIKAIEAAALLHDVGKLAIPDHILNKPGKLTPFEFDQMKAHASIGAEILSGIKFPYPLVPIVRHHHEAWDGSGYPDGLSGDAIPFGARVLAVVDCHDAVTSDRPYRRALSAEAAFGILNERRGTMYDPAVVDAFIALCRAEASEPAQADEHRREAAIHDITKAERLSRIVAPDTTEPEALRSLLDSVAFGLGSDVEYVLFLHRPASDSVVASSVATLKSEPPLKLPLGEGISGWVGANRRSIINSAAALDLGPMAAKRQPPLRSTAAVPVLAGDTLQGVLTFYSTRDRTFTIAHAAALECLGQLIALGIDQSLFAAPRSQESIVLRPGVVGAWTTGR